MKLLYKNCPFFLQGISYSCFLKQKIGQSCIVSLAFPEKAKRKLVFKKR